MTSLRPGDRITYWLPPRPTPLSIRIPDAAFDIQVESKDPEPIPGLQDAIDRTNERYGEDDDGEMFCRDCGSIVRFGYLYGHDLMHEAIGYPAPECVCGDRSLPGTHRTDGPCHEDDPEPPFPIGARVRNVNESSGTVYVVTGWDWYGAWGKWMVRVEYLPERLDDEGQPEYSLHYRDELELVPEPESEIQFDPETAVRLIRQQAIAECIAAVGDLRAARHRHPDIDPSDYSTAFDYAQDVALAALKEVRP